VFGDLAALRRRGPGTELGEDSAADFIVHVQCWSCGL
jgi:hypothetical protein